MARLLYITCNLKSKEQSRSLSVGERFRKLYVENNPNDIIETIDVYDEHIQRYDKDVLGAMYKLKNGMSVDDLTDIERTKMINIWASAENFASADKYVFVTPMWNLSFPAEMKIYLDTICVVGKTFAYTKEGAVGLLKGKGKKCLSIHSSGGFHYGKEEDHSVPYLYSLMQFMGVEDFEALILEGVDAQSDKLEELKNKALDRAEVLAKLF
ncbi:FMN-dependent NADH-azoreductase [Seleniivibrio woodruffii]|uniref:FMN dependent NADH:quinone oxidoreductase n=1 Tax=Seleniivibrio woodruffii TaxID=1078050 RepID=A0A4V2PRD6_9BACT|nr:NAD(P)H-dependent oxidoreductase [Seleniivibrio woodruffii]TCK58471.1 FMN-dependent NADH-azoreductase [Seleniivibrio woodruffii]TVZ36844.1 FMN-dependent NADH-azoreductase [Seleniivibrio woodruffii]